jgi:hypothetical protein
MPSLRRDKEKARSVSRVHNPLNFTCAKRQAAKRTGYRYD